MAQMQPEKTNIYIIEDDQLILDSLQSIIEAEPGFSFMGGATSAETALRELENIQPHILLLDVSLPGMNGIEALPLIKEIQPELNILMLTVHEDADTVFSALRFGAVGYLLKGATADILFKGIRDVMNGGAPISPSIARSIVDTFRVENIPVLSERELEVLNKLGEGSNNGQIAKELFVSTNTIKAHVKNIYKKLHVHSRVEAVKKGLLKGLIK